MNTVRPLMPVAVPKGKGKIAGKGPAQGFSSAGTHGSYTVRVDHGEGI